MNPEITELVIARLETLPANLKMSIGNYGEFTKEELIEHVKKRDQIGNKMVEIELEFLKAMKEGVV